MTPRIRKPRLIELAALPVWKIGGSGDVVFLHDGKSGAQHSRRNQTVKKLRIKALSLGLLFLLTAGVRVPVRVPVRVQLLNEDSNHLHAGLIHSVALLDRDVLSHVPRDLAERANHALVGPLRADFAVQGLQLNVSSALGFSRNNVRVGHSQRAC